MDGDRPMRLKAADADDCNRALAKSLPQLRPHGCELRVFPNAPPQPSQLQTDADLSLRPPESVTQQRSNLLDCQAVPDRLDRLAANMPQHPNKSREERAGSVRLQLWTEAANRVDDGVDAAKSIERPLTERDGSVPLLYFRWRAGHEAHHSSISMIVMTRRVAEASAGFSEP